MSQIRSTIKHAFIYSGASLLGKAVGFIMLPVYAHFLRGTGYGIIGMIDVVLSVLTLLIGYGISGGLRRFYFDRQSIDERNTLVSSTLILMLVLVVVVSAPAYFFRNFISLLAFGDKSYGFYITLALLTFIADMSSKNAESYILILQKSVFFSILSLIRLVTALSLNIYLIAILRLGVLGYLYSGLIVAVIYSLFTHIYTFHKTGVRFSKNDALEILRFSLPLLPGYVAMFFRNNVDRIILRTYLGLSTLGAYEMLFKFATLIGVIITEPFMKIWDVKRFQASNTDDGPIFMARVFSIKLFILLQFGLVLSLEIPILLKILTPEEFWLTGTIASLAVMSRVALAAYYHFFFGLLYAKLTIRISIIQFVTAFISVCLSWVAIKYYGILGAVSASLFVALVQCTMAHQMSKKLYFIPFEWKKIILLTGSAIFLFMVIKPVTVDFLGINEWIKWELYPQVNKLFHFMPDITIFHKIQAKLEHGLPYMVEGFIKIILVLAFIPMAMYIGTIPKMKLKSFLRYDFINKSTIGN